MKRISIGVGLLVSTSALAADYVVTAPSCLNVRTRASLSGGKVVDCIDNNSKVQVVGRSGVFYQVLVDGKKYYMNRKFLAPAPAAPAVAQLPPAAPGPTEEPQLLEPPTLVARPVPVPPPAVIPPAVNPAPPINTQATGVPDEPPAPTNPLTGGPAARLPGTGKIPSMWDSAMSVMSENVIPKGKGSWDYNINSPNWPKVSLKDGKVKVDFGNRNNGHKLLDTRCMCTSGTATAVSKHFADLANAGQFKLTQEHLNVLNGPMLHNAINGQRNSVGAFYKAIGGTSIQAIGNKEARKALTQAKAGDVLIIDRNSGSGHATIFKEIKGNQFCYFSCNQGKPAGASERCESIGVLSALSLSRFPTDLASVPAKLLQFSKDPKLVRQLTSGRAANTLGANQVAWDTTLSTAPIRSVATQTADASH